MGMEKDHTFHEETLESEYLYKGRIINLRKDKVTVKTGTSTREIVEHNGGSVICAITEEGNILLVRQFRKAVERTVLEVPAGKREGEEDPLETAVRELKEETGYTAERMELLTAMETSVGYTTEVLYIYLATGLTSGETNPDANEVLHLEEYPLEEVFEKVCRGEFRDSKTIVAVMLAREALKKREKGCEER